MEEQEEKKKMDKSAATAGADQTPDKAVQLPGVGRSDTPSLNKTGGPENDAAAAQEALGEDEPEDFWSVKRPFWG